MINYGFWKFVWLELRWLGVRLMVESNVSVIFIFHLLGWFHKMIDVHLLGFVLVKMDLIWRNLTVILRWRIWSILTYLLSWYTLLFKLLVSRFNHLWLSLRKSITFSYWRCLWAIILIIWERVYWHSLAILLWSIWILNQRGSILLIRLDHIIDWRLTNHHCFDRTDRCCSCILKHLFWVINFGDFLVSHASNCVDIHLRQLPLIVECHFRLCIIIQYSPIVRCGSPTLSICLVDQTITSSKWVQVGEFIAVACIN